MAIELHREGSGPDARHVALGTGHVPYFDDPDAVAEVIRSRASHTGA